MVRRDQPKAGPPADAGLPGQDSVGGRITALRRRRGWTQGQLADAVGVSRSAVAQWETDRAGQGRGTLARIAVALDITLDGLLHGTGGVPDVTGDELALLRLYRECPPAAQAELLIHARRLRDSETGRSPRTMPSDANPGADQGR